MNKRELKKLKAKQKEEKRELYYNKCIELFEKHKDNIKIGKIYHDRIYNMHYQYLQYDHIAQLIQEYETYFSDKEGYNIWLYDKYLQIRNTYYEDIEKYPYITYHYGFKNKKIYIEHISKNVEYITDPEEYKKYSYK